MRDKFLHFQKKYFSRKNIFYNYAVTVFELTIASFFLCLLIGVGCQLLYVARFFHCAKSFLHKLIYFGFPLTALVSYYFYSQISFPKVAIPFSTFIVNGEPQLI